MNKIFSVSTAMKVTMGPLVEGYDIALKSWQLFEKFSLCLNIKNVTCSSVYLVKMPILLYPCFETAGNYLQKTLFMSKHEDCNRFLSVSGTDTSFTVQSFQVLFIMYPFKAAVSHIECFNRYHDICSGEPKKASHAPQKYTMITWSKPMYMVYCWKVFLII